MYKDKRLARIEKVWLNYLVHKHLFKNLTRVEIRDLLDKIKTIQPESSL